MSDRRDTARALLDRFAPRVAERDRSSAHERLCALVEAHVGESPAMLAGRASVLLADLLAPTPLTLDLDPCARPPSSTSNERAHRARARRMHEAPPELLDGLPLGWSEDVVGRDEILALWRERRAVGPRPGERRFGYVHLPFCRTRCAFCQFESILDARPSARERLVSEIEREAAALRDAIGSETGFDAVTLGGGTPSELEARELARVLAAIDPLFRLREVAYVSAEVNPDSATADRISVLVEAGVTRLSMGVQSMHAPTLRAVARGYQDAAMVQVAVATIRMHSRVVLSLDLLAPLPEETERSFREGLDATLALEPDELVLYRYQPVLRGGARTIAPGSLPWARAREAFLDAVVRAGLELATQTGGSLVARRPGTPVPTLRYVQHPHRPTSIIGLGPFAESHVFGHGRYVALEDGTRYRRVRTDVDHERSLLVGRALAMGAPIDESVLRESTSRSLSAWRGEAVGALLERGVLAREGDALVARGSDREATLEASWAFLDPGTLRGLRAEGSRRAVLETAQASRHVALTVRALEALLLDEDDGALRTKLGELITPARAELATRAMFDGLLAPELETREDDGTLVHRVRVEPGSDAALALAEHWLGARPPARPLELVVEAPSDRAGVVVRVRNDAPVLRAIVGERDEPELEAIETLLELFADGRAHLLLRARGARGHALLATLLARWWGAHADVVTDRLHADKSSKVDELRVPCTGMFPLLTPRTRDCEALRVDGHDARRRLPVLPGR